MIRWFYKMATVESHMFDDEIVTGMGLYTEDAVSGEPQCGLEVCGAELEACGKLLSDFPKGKMMEFADGDRMSVLLKGQDALDTLVRIRESLSELRGAGGQAAAEKPGGGEPSDENGGPDGSNPNRNTLENMRCPNPECGDPYGPFRVSARSVFDLHDDGTGFHGDVEWDESSYFSCPGCETCGTAAEFMQPKQNFPKYSADGGLRCPSCGGRSLRYLEDIVCHRAVLEVKLEPRKDPEKGPLAILAVRSKYESGEGFDDGERARLSCRDCAHEFFIPAGMHVEFFD
jgi:hypothetical protein